MPNTFNSSTFSSTYRDDYQDSDNYYRILFNSGKALQARELTQLQTIIQSEMSRLGRNIFKDGARVSAGGITVDNDRKYVKISSVLSGGSFSNIQVGTTFVGQNNSYQARVIDVKPIGVDGFTENTLYLQYIGANGASGTVSSTTAVFEGNEQIDGGGYSLIVSGAAGGVGSGTKLIVGEGSYFVLGRFVFTPKQELFLEKYSRSANAKVVFEITEDVITVNDTQDLYDNSGASANLASPGADRYRIRMTLKKEGNVSVGASSVYLCTIVNSLVAEQIYTYDGFNQIKHFMALRTKEESGNYIVNPFLINFEDRNLVDDKLDLIVGSGTAYVNGYRVQNQYPKRLLVPKPTGSELVNNQAVGVNYGNYVLVSSGKDLPELDLGDVTLYDAPNAVTPIGTAKIRSIDYQNGTSYLRVYLFDISMNAGKKFREVASIGNSGTDYLNLVLEGSGNNTAVLYKAERNSLLIPLPRPRPAQITDITLTIQRRFTGTTNGSGQLVLPASALTGGEQFADTDRWIAANTTDGTSFQGLFYNNINGGAGDGATQVTISGLVASKTYTVLGYVSRPGIVRTKTLTTATPLSGQALATAGGITYFTFPQFDVSEIIEIRQANNTGAIITDAFLFDNGQTDNVYKFSRLILKEGRENPGTIYVEYKYWAHGGSGNFFAATSYGGTGVDYSNIPAHKTAQGNLIQLRNYIDLRPYADGSNFGVKDQIELPRSGSSIRADISYYTPRADKLLMTQEGELKVLMGVQAENPQFKPTPENSIELYKIILNGNTLTPKDLQIQPIDHKRYTMKDISKLERKFDDFAARTDLSLLEINAKLSVLFDSDGNLRPVSAIWVDDFSDQTGIDNGHPDNGGGGTNTGGSGSDNANTGSGGSSSSGGGVGGSSYSIDPESRVLRPGFDEDNIRLVFDSAASDAANAARWSLGADIVTIKHTESVWQEQLLASGIIELNPNAVARTYGAMSLSPASDEWKETFYSANYVLEGAQNISTNQATLWNEWLWNWAGRSAEDIYNTVYTGNGTGQTVGDWYVTENTRDVSESSEFVTRALSNQTVRETIGDNTVDIALVPWIRSRKIYFRAQGLKPDTKFVPFFDGVDVSDWVKKEAYVSWGERDDDIGNQYQNLTQHPDTPTELYTDANGEVSGSFVIPNVRPVLQIDNTTLQFTEIEQGLRFRSGKKEFKLIDTTVTDITAAGSSASAYYTAKGVFETEVDDVSSTRLIETAWAVPSASSGIFPYYTAAEITSTLDLLSASDFYMVEPHPSGVWSPGDAAVNVADYDNTDTMSELVSDYVSVDQNQLAGAEAAAMPGVINPLAQTFYVDNQYGLVLTKVDLFFAQKDNKFPVRIHIRAMKDGSPSGDVVPNSESFLNQNQVNVTPYTPGSTLLTTVLSAPSTFTFSEPVYLKPWTEYAIVVTAESADYKVYMAKSQDYVIGPTGSQRILTQPAPGEMFLPQTGSEWLPSKEYDLMYRFTRAVYDNNCSVILHNATVPGKLLLTNPIITQNGSSLVYIKHPSHGLDSAGPDPIVLTLNNSLNDAGFTEADFNGSHNVVYSDAGGVMIDVGSNAAASKAIGGDAVVASRNIQFNLANPYIQSLIPPGCSIDVTAKFTTGKSVRGGTETKYVKDTSYNRLTPGQNTVFGAPRTIMKGGLETSILGAGIKSLDVKINLMSENDYVSPLIDLQRVSMYLIENNIDNGGVINVETGAIEERDETNPWMGEQATGSRAISTPVSIGENTAVGARVTVDTNIPDGTEVELYYRATMNEDTLLDQPWKLVQPVDEIPTSDGPYAVQNREYLIGGQGGFEPTFNQFQHKFVMKSSNQAVVPELKNLAITFLGL